MEIIKIIILDALYMTLIRAMAILHMESIGFPILEHIMQVVVLKKGAVSRRNIFWGV